ncbi:MAG: T9SS type A sorting domain-containing protein, partial [Luteibaculum sp.]
EILDTSLVNLAVQICEGTSYSFDGQELTQSGQYTAVFSNQAGCDSTVNLNLTVVPEIVNDGNEFNICEGETVIVGGISYNEAGNYSQTFTSQAGCDSTYNFEVIVNEAFQENRSETICSGDSLLFFGEYLKSAGVYDTVFQRTNGCDSTIRMVLSEIPSYAFFDTAFVCQGDTLDFEGQVIFNPGKYVANLQTEAGCDSILNLRVYRKENVFFEKFSNLCFGDTLIFGEQEITGAGVYTETFESFSGCDSTVRLTITQFVLDTGLTINGNTLVSKESNATYQWINCETGQAISGATTMSFNTNQPGTYAVVISRDGCSDSSRCVELNKTSIFEIQSRSTPISVFPNPAKNLLSVDLNSVNQNYTYSITDLQGRIIQTGQLSKGSNVIKIEDLGQGSYFLRLEDGEKKFFARFIKY